MYELADCKNEIKDAGELQRVTRDSERLKREAGIEYDEQHVRHSIVHTREDIILFVPLITHILSQAKKINRKLSILVALLFLLVIILLFK